MPLILLAQSLPFPSRSGDAVRPVKGRICASESGTRILLERNALTVPMVISKPRRTLFKKFRGANNWQVCEIEQGGRLGTSYDVCVVSSLTCQLLYAYTNSAEIKLKCVCRVLIEPLGDVSECWGVTT